MLERKNLRAGAQVQRPVDRGQLDSPIGFDAGLAVPSESPVRPFRAGWIAIGVGMVLLSALVLSVFIHFSAPQPLATYQARTATEAEVAEFVLSTIGGGSEEAGGLLDGASGSLYVVGSGRFMLADVPQIGSVCLLSHFKKSFGFISCGMNRAPIVLSVFRSTLIADPELSSRLEDEGHEQVLLMAFEDRLEVWPLDPSPSPSPTSD